MTYFIKMCTQLAINILVFLCLTYRTQNVFEKDMVKPFTCYAEAFPSARYYWNFEEGNFTTVGPTLTFRHGIRRYQVGGAGC